ncbi:MAG: hypothetical protein HY394_06285 [Candidatus Diapherotrites archaeon]|nr:hypothetical protein [Candidatus Diapherotrites archaeon]
MARLNQKGVFSALIAVVAVVLLVSTIYNSQALGRQANQAISRQNILPANAQLQQTVFLLDKAAGDALADQAYQHLVAQGGTQCYSPNFPSPLYETRVRDYFTNVFAQTGSGIECKIDSLEFDGNPAGTDSLGTPSLHPGSCEAGNKCTSFIRISPVVSCEIRNTGFRARVSKNAVFEKELLYYKEGADCKIEVLDLQSGLLDVLP